MVQINLASSSTSPYLVSSKKSTASSISTALQKKIDIANYNITNDKFIKTVNIGSIFSSFGGIDWDNIDSELSLKKNQNEGKIFDSEKGMFVEQYDLKTADSFNDLIMRYSLIKTKIEDTMSKDSQLNDTLATLKDKFKEKVTDLSNLIGVEFTDFYSGSFTGKITLPNNTDYTGFDTEDFVETTVNTILTRANDFQKYIEENKTKWTDYSTYITGKSSYMGNLDFLDYLKNTDTDPDGAKTVTSLNFKELNDVTKVILSVANNLNINNIAAAKTAGAPNELISGMNIGLALLKVQIAGEQLGLSSASSVMLTVGAGKTIAGIVENLTTDTNMKVTETNIYLYGGYLSQIAEGSLTSISFKNEFKEAITAIKTTFSENEDEYDSSKIINNAYNEWNKYLDFINAKDLSKYSVPSQTESTIDIFQ